LGFHDIYGGFYGSGITGLDGCGDLVHRWLARAAKSHDCILAGYGVSTVAHT
jgi:hypothetical protein